MHGKSLLIVFLLASCLQVGTGTGTGSGAAASPPLVQATDAAPSGTGCFEEPQSQTILCKKVALCPGIEVDPGGFPDCGFHMRAGAQLDLECLCGTALCPIGVPTSCDQAKQLLDAENALIVCAQQAEGRCVELAARDAGGSGACDRGCAAECAGAPTCVQLCGC